MVKRYKIRELSQPRDGHTLAAIFDNVDCVLGSDYDALAAQNVALLADVNQDEGYERLKAKCEKLEALLRELIDIEGPQPGHVMWYRKVCESLGIQSENASKDDHG